MKQQLNPLNSTQRAAAIQRLSGEHWDLLVIGGGITGAGIALDAAARGLKTALVEMQDFASGTSSRSTKLIHGGLRYLKQYEFRLVAEVGRERAILHRNAPHVVIPERMLLPVTEDGTFGWLGVSVGLKIYDWLAGVKKEERRRMLDRDRTQAQEPLLKPKGLNAAGLYSEYRTDDARLTIEVIKTAVAQGAWCLNHLKVTEFNYQQGRLIGAKVEDQLEGGVHNISARWVVNAAGPWVDGLRQLDSSLQGKRLHHTKGVHLVVPYKRLPIRQSVYFDIADGRMMFAIPRQPWTYIGTTDTNYKGDLAHPRVTRQDVDYLLNATNAVFPDVQLTAADISSSWAGIRPLIHEEGKAPSQLSRKDEIFFAPSGLITIAGGKLTGFRKMAERVTNLVVEEAFKAGVLSQKPKCSTDRIQLVGGNFRGAKDMKDSAKDWSKKHGVELKEVEWLLGLYGSETPHILSLATGKSKANIVLAALEYGILQEGVHTLDDFFSRRTALLYFGRDWIAPVQEAVATHLQNRLGGSKGPDPEATFARNYHDALDFPESEA